MRSIEINHQVGMALASHSRVIWHDSSITVTGGPLGVHGNLIWKYTCSIIEVIAVIHEKVKKLPKRLYYLINESCDGVKCSLILQPFSLKVFYTYTFTQSLSSTLFQTHILKLRYKDVKEILYITTPWNLID